MEGCVNKNLDETHRYISKHVIKPNWDAIKMLIEEFPDGHDDEERKSIREY